MKKLTLTSAILGVLYAGAAVASDLEIYSAAKPGEGGKTVLTLMLDKSGSMKYASGASCGSVGHSQSGKTYLDYWFDLNGDKKKTNNEVGSISKLNYKKCRDGRIIYTDKMSALRAAMHELFTTNKLKDEYHIGIGFYPHLIRGYAQNFGNISVPAKPLTLQQRKNILDAVSKVYASGGTPFANAYAEAGAYMMGTSPKTSTYEKDINTYTQIGYVIPAEEASTSWVRYTRSSCQSQGGRWYRNYRRKCYINRRYTNYYRQAVSAKPARLYKCTGTNLSTTGDDKYLTCGRGSGAEVDRNANESGLNLSLIGYQNTSDYTRYGDRYYSVVTSTETFTDGDEYSGFAYSSASTKVQPSKTKYKMPDYSDGECGGSGNGIYFMTDGVPEGNSAPARVMKSSLKGGTAQISSINDFQCRGTNVLDDSIGKSGSYSSWSCIGEYSKLLRDKNNPSGEEIRTAAVGFGTQFSNVPKIDKKVGEDKDGKDIIEKVYDCGKLTADARNLCYMGEKGYGYGEGGTYFVTDAEQIAQSIIDFASDLVVSDKEPEPISTGNFSIPFDPFGSKDKFDSYLPMLDPKIGKTDLWLGNVKKYKIKDGAIVGQNNTSVLNVLKNDGTFNKTTKDYWNMSSEQNDDGKSQKGGVLSNIFLDGSKERNLWVDVTSTNNNLALKNLSVNTSKVPQNFDDMGAGYDNKGKRQLLNFLGYPVEVNSDALTDGNGKMIALTEGFDATHKTHGAVLHSTPQLLTKKVKFKDGKIMKSSREDFMIYGSFDGSMRIVDDKTGKEALTFVPKHMVMHQGDYLVPKSKLTSSIRHGVDAIWTVYADYQPKSSSGEVSMQAKNVVVAGGLRMGGSRYYALSIADADFTKPEILYNVGSGYGPDGKNDGTGHPDFSRMGQSWGMPTPGYIKTGENADGTPKRTMVHFLPGGYDLKYENGTDLSGKTTYGNAVYMVKVGEVSADLETKTEGGKSIVTNDKGVKINYSGAGQRMWWASANASNVTTGSKRSTKVDDMTGSIVGSVVPLDRDYDGVTDHIYYADLNGRVFRADIDNSGTTYKIARVVKVLDVSSEKSTSDDKSAPRFYEAPLITFTRWKYGVAKGKIVAMVSITSGNRSRPVELNRSASSPDRVYSFVDYDVASNDKNFFDDSKYTKKTSDLKISDLVKLAFTGSGKTISEKKTDRKTVKQHMTLTTKAKQGWYYDLVNWGDNTTTSVSGLKGVGALHAIEGLLFFTTFNPNPSTTPPVGCAPSIKGETQRDVLCLPFGSCNQKDNPVAPKVDKQVLSKYSPVPAGRGIANNSIGLLNVGGKGGFGVIKNDPATCDNTVSPYCESYGNKDFMEPMEWRER